MTTADADRTAACLIDQSTDQDTIAHAPYTPELADALLALCDDHVDAGEVVEYWSTGGEDSDHDTMTWRVHLDRDVDHCDG